jgi:hypothetical protein
MPSMLDHESNRIVKMLVLGDSGNGKTGAVASLLDAGLKIRALDFDNGLSVIKGYVKDKTKLKNMHYITLKDEMTLQAARIGIKKAAAFQRAMDALDGKKDMWGEDFGPLTSWGEDVVLLVDSLSMMGRSSLQMVMQANAKGFAAPEIQHYGTAMENLEKFLDIVTSNAVKCHVLINTHTTSIEGTAKLFPEALGSKLPPKVGKFFDNMISLSVSGSTRTFKTDKDGLLALKTATKLNPTYPIETGLADIFKALTGKKELV